CARHRGNYWGHFDSW
nr:immunoglobulin heavy chain junction region [Macaca mulatta]MOV51035.1 immunoglobulin heavy chain junction region [Macaca mulatta]MOV51156.1 immunoglobulin heavy chain junction region [Macaca mulatta]MOV52756.1 immunoglobulin heavy chain junction region [Macaca mulatta]MOV53040.1 immunoglobulin heavy chain junction region [Macaca mulatta]